MIKIPTLITDEYLAEFSVLPTNFDYSEIHPFVPIAEEIWIVPIIGRQLYNELLEQVQDNSVTDVNSTLLLKIYQLEAQCIVYEALPFVWANLTDKGITLGKSDNSDSVKLDGLSELTNHLKSQISVLETMLKDFLNRNADCYPSYGVEYNCCEKKLEDNRFFPNSYKKDKRNY